MDAALVERWVEEHWAARDAAWRARREWKRQAREEFAEARRFGLAARQAAKLARIHAACTVSADGTVHCVDSPPYDAICPRRPAATPSSPPRPTATPQPAGAAARQWTSGTARKPKRIVPEQLALIAIEQLITTKPVPATVAESTASTARTHQPAPTATPADQPPAAGVGDVRQAATNTETATTAISKPPRPPTACPWQTSIPAGRRSRPGDADRQRVSPGAARSRRQAGSGRARDGSCRDCTAPRFQRDAAKRRRSADSGTAAAPTTGSDPPRSAARRLARVHRAPPRSAAR
jgi:hypothetical protein